MILDRLSQIQEKIFNPYFSICYKIYYPFSTIGTQPAVHLMSEYSDVDRVPCGHFWLDYRNKLRDQVITRTNEATGVEQGDLTLFQVMGSVFAASFGVQSKENKVRDFERGKPVHFIITGLAFTVIFLVTLVTVVNLVV